jgi:hypothetical protein
MGWLWWNFDDRVGETGWVRTSPLAPLLKGEGKFRDSVLVDR